MALFEQGLTARQIAPVVGIDERNVRRHLRLAGIPDQRWPQAPPKRELRPVRFTDVPMETRLEAADMLIQGSTATRRARLLAANWPSETTYWVRS